MSQILNNKDNAKFTNARGSNNKQKFIRKGRNADSFNYKRAYKDFHYYSTKYNFRPHWGYHRRKYPYQRPRTAQNESQRPPSPFSGTEEYTLRKIQETSDMIKRKLMMPPEADDVTQITETTVVNNETATNTSNKNNSTSESERNSVKSSSKRIVQYDVEEIHEKIVTHITKLSHGKKMNLICANSSGYDIAIQQIQKQKRLELSKVLRDMCSNQTAENGEVINAIIPDIGIKIEELPLEVIQELSNTLDLNFDDYSYSQKSGNISVKNELRENDDVYIEPDNIKQEVIEIMDDDIKTEIAEIKHEVVDIKDEPYTVDCMEDDTDCILNENTSNQNCNTTVTVCSQTEIDYKSVGTQTTCDLYNQATKISNLDDGVKLMLTIDEEIKKLTELRQSIFLKLHAKNARKKNVDNNMSDHKTNDSTSDTYKYEETNGLQKTHKEVANARQQQEMDCDLSPSLNTLIEERDIYFDKPLDFSSIKEKILVIKVMEFEDTILAASESGKVFFINTLDSSTLRILTASEKSITSLCCWLTHKKKQPHLLVGSMESKIREYNYHSNRLIRVISITESVQCMEQAWNSIFIGTTSGSLLRYSLQLFKIEFEEKISKDSILVLKATQEGARRVLLVGTRNASVCVRDAMSGLHLRTMNDFVTPTVYSLVLENNMVYCGTTFHDILVFSFHDGSLVHKFEAANSKGMSCMKVVGNLLLASCYNGNIYVYNIKTHKQVGVIEGPGGVILSMEVLKNIVIVGTMSRKFESLLIPENMLQFVS